jgi:predicted NAD/FAD-dependent oxidoreductase
MRADRDAWVVHAAPEWSRANLRAPAEVIERALVAELAGLVGLGSLRVASSTLQRWAFARAPSPLERPLFDDAARIGVGGDWASGGRVEGAYLAGVALASRLLAP